MNTSMLHSGLLAFLVTSLAGSTPGTAQQTSRSGVVLDATTGRPLGAAVVAAGAISTLTALDGTFSITVPADIDEVRVERVGYAPTTVRIAAWSGVIRLDPEPYLLERLDVEVRGGEALAAGTALAVARVDRAAIDAAGGTTVADALNNLEGVEDSRVGSWGARPVIRGLTGERIVVLIDGNRVNRACTFGMDQGLASVDPAQVERVEVLSGPGSTLFGSGSLGGVINVVTRHAQGTAGSGGEVRVGGSTAIPGGSAGATVWTAHERVDATLAVDGAWYGDYRVPGAMVDGSSYRQWTGDGKASFRPAENHVISVKGQRYEGRDIGWPMMRGAQIPQETRTSASLDYGWQGGPGMVDAGSLRVFRQRLDHHMTLDAIMTGPMGAMTVRADAVSHSTTTGARAQLRLVPAGGSRADLGAEVNRWSAEGTRWSESGSGAMPPSSDTFRTWPAVEITDFGAFLQSEARVVDRLRASAGARVDHIRRSAEDAVSVTETIATGNVGVWADIGRGFGARGSVGMGYRTPDPMELYGLALKPDGYVYRGRADLATERSLGTEVALSRTGAGVDAGITVFRNHIDDMVSLVLVQGETVAGRPVREYTTLTSAILKGITANASLRLPADLEGHLTASALRGSDGATGEPLPAMPPWTAHVTVRRTFSTTPLRWVEVEVSGAGSQNRVSATAGETVTAGWDVAALRWALELGGVRATAGVENLFNRAYRSHLDPVALLRPGRNLFVRLNRAF